MLQSKTQVLEHSVNTEQIASGFLELAGELRLGILLALNEDSYSLTKLAKRLGSTTQEVHRNLDRLGVFGLVKKDHDRKYAITLVGKIICAHFPTFDFIWKRREFFSSHILGNLPLPLIQRLGALNNCQFIEGVTCVLEKWRSIYMNADKFICDVIAEVPPGIDEPLLKKINENKVKYNHIINEKLMEPNNRRSFLKKNGYYDQEEQGTIERKKIASVKVALIMNEKEGCIIFPNNKKRPDLSYMFYGNDPDFLAWCNDYFDYCWDNSESVRGISRPD